ncbi:MAG TPA: glycine zipper domain-containing protein [Pirellulales bacterium]|jgi:hypothetical protein|nr:glycine zipper domain-containing protein [Pirellulales bacterium]
MHRNFTLGLVALITVAAVGCQTNTETGALAGGGIGAVVGGIIGHQFHSTAAGAAIGAGAGALTGAAIGNQVDKDEARNRALIERQLGRPMPGAVSVDDAIAMTRAGVAEPIIIDHVNAVGVLRPLTTEDIIYLQRNGVSPRVVQTMQHPAMQPPPMVVQQGPPPPVVVEDPYYYRPYYHPWYYRRPPPPPGIGVTIVP